MNPVAAKMTSPMASRRAGADGGRLLKKLVQLLLQRIYSVELKTPPRINLVVGLTGLVSGVRSNQIRVKMWLRVLGSIVLYLLSVVY